MLRITQSKTESVVTIRLEGSLSGLWVEEARTAIAALDPDAGMELDLSDLRYADLSGAKLLADLCERGARVLAASRFVAQLLNI